jgi:DNA-binding beta-propeller fold protein YncE
MRNKKQSVLTCLLWTLASAIMNHVALGQVTVVTTPSCQRCVITLVPETVLGLNVAAEGPTTFSTVTRNSRGVYFVTPTFEAGTISVFNSSGAFLRTGSRPGRGPGELGLPQRIRVSSHDTIYVLDAVRGPFGIVWA